MCIHHCLTKGQSFHYSCRSATNYTNDTEAGKSLDFESSISHIFWSVIIKKCTIQNSHALTTTILYHILVHNCLRLKERKTKNKLLVISSDWKYKFFRNIKNEILIDLIQLIILNIGQKVDILVCLLAHYNMHLLNFVDNSFFLLTKRSI